MLTVLNQPGKPCSDFMVSIDAVEKRRAFLDFNAHLAVKNAISNKSIEIFNGIYWNDLHTTTTVSVRSGDIWLLKVAGMESCPGLNEQLTFLYPEVNLSR